MTGSAPELALVIPVLNITVEFGSSGCIDAVLSFGDREIVIVAELTSRANTSDRTSVSSGNRWEYSELLGASPFCRRNSNSNDSSSSSRAERSGLVASARRLSMRAGCREFNDCANRLPRNCMWVGLDAWLKSVSSWGSFGMSNSVKARLSTVREAHSTNGIPIGPSSLPTGTFCDALFAGQAEKKSDVHSSSVARRAIIACAFSL